LFVPPAGQVSVIGWVYKPVVVPVTQGLTTLGAVSAAGGMLYAADQTAVKIMRREPGDQTKVIEVNLEEVKKGNATDVALQANDVVDVGYSAAKIPGYALYYAAQGIVSFAPAALLMGGL
jgi:protein involved in polysaccharide export with SLBB domain